MMNYNKMCHTVIFYDPFTQLHKLFISTLIHELQLYNINYEVINTIHLNPNVKYDSVDYTIILFLNPQFLKTNKELYLEFINISKIFKYKVYYITEPLDYIIDIKVWQEFIKILKPYKLLTYSSENLNKLNVYQPIYKLSPKFNNYIDICDFSIQNLRMRQINKMIFMGNVNENREKYFNLPNIVDKVIIKNDIWNMDEMQEIMEKNLFFINIHRRNNCKCLEYLRIVPLLANGCIILSEKANIDDILEFENYNIYFFEREDIINGYNNLIDKIKNSVNQDGINNFYKSTYERVIKFRDEFKYNKNDIYSKLLNL